MILTWRVNFRHAGGIQSSSKQDYCCCFFLRHSSGIKLNLACNSALCIYQREILAINNAKAVPPNLIAKTKLYKGTLFLASLLWDNKKWTIHVSFVLQDGRLINFTKLLLNVPEIIRFTVQGSLHIYASFNKPLIPMCEMVLYNLSYRENRSTKRFLESIFIISRIRDFITRLKSISHRLNFAVQKTSEFSETRGLY